MSNERTPSPTSARDDMDRGPLIGKKGAVIVAIALGVVVVLLVITYAVGTRMRNLRDPQRYMSNLKVAVDRVAAGSDTSKSIPTVEVIGTITNQGDRDVWGTVEVLLKDKDDRTVGVNREDRYDRFSGTFGVQARNSVTYIVQIEPISKGWVPEKTVARITKLNFGDR